MAENKLVSVIVRTFDGRLDFLERSLFSIYCDRYPDKQVVLVYQGTDSAYLAGLEKFKEIYPELNIKIIQNPTNDDERARNFNLGIKNADGRYICFLDDDDVVFPNHMSTLVGALEKSGRAWSYSQVCIDIENNGYVTRKESRYRHEKFSFVTLWRKNYLPIITVMVDSERLSDRSLLLFDEGLNKYEDYAFLLKLAYHYEPERCGEVTNIYKIRSDGSNTVLYRLTDNAQVLAQKKDEWDRAEAQIEKIREDLSSGNYWFKETIETAFIGNSLKKDPKQTVRMSWAISKKKRLRIILEKKD